MLTTDYGPLLFLTTHYYSGDYMGKQKLPRGVPFSLFAVIFLIVAIVYIQFLYPAAVAGPKQPIPFSHRLHVNIKKIDCYFCHSTVERTRFAGLPAVEKCLYCHQYIIPEHPQIKKLQGYADRGEPVPWRKVTWLPDHVYFTHQRHIKAGVTCNECHGDVQHMDRIHEVFPDPLDEVLMLGSPFKMGFCLECHQKSEKLNVKVTGFENAKTDAELIRLMTGEYKGTRAPVDCWICHQ